MATVAFTRRTSAIEKGNVTDKIRAFIVERLGFDVESVTVDSHFTHDLGMDLFDVVELMILIEDQFTDVEITDLDRDIEFVGDLVAHIEILADARANRKQTSSSDRSTWRAKQSSGEIP